MRVAHWVSCSRMTVRVVTENGVIVEAAPAVRGFLGQPLWNLKLWFRKFGGLQVEKLGLCRKVSV